MCEKTDDCYMKEDIEKAIQLLIKHDFRTVSSVTGEYVEKFLAKKLGAEQTDNCQKGYDLVSKKFGKIEVKSRNADSKSIQCTLNKHA